MAFTPFVETDQPTMAKFNEKFQDAISDAIAGGIAGGIAGSPKIMTGSYIGTGTFLSSSPNTLTFPFTPIIWGVFRMVSTGGVDLSLPNIILWDNDYKNTNVSMYTRSDSTTTQFVTINGNSVSWYSSSSGEHQLNANGTTYHYFAIG